MRIDNPYTRPFPGEVIEKSRLNITLSSLLTSITGFTIDPPNKRLHSIDKAFRLIEAQRDGESQALFVSLQGVCWLFCLSQEMFVRIPGVSMAEPEKGILIINGAFIPREGRFRKAKGEIFQWNEGRSHGRR